MPHVNKETKNLLIHFSQMTLKQFETMSGFITPRFSPLLLLSVIKSATLNWLCMNKKKCEQILKKR